MKLYIKHMVSYRCILVVQAELNKLGVNYNNIELGIVEISEPLSEEHRQALKIRLNESGLELYENRKNLLTEQIKAVILEMIYETEEIPRVNYSEYISSKLNCDYTFLANSFSEVNGITIQQFIVLNKIERVKQLILEANACLSEISYRLNYSSVAHLSNQFKKHTGLTPSCYKQLMANSQSDSQMA